jgi:hypothetical protein
MNLQIEIVRKWLADPDSLTVEELKENERESYRALTDRSALSLPWNDHALLHTVNWAAYTAHSCATGAFSLTSVNYWILERIAALKEFDSIGAKVLNPAVYDDIKHAKLVEQGVELNHTVSVYAGDGEIITENKEDE